MKEQEVNKRSILIVDDERLILATLAKGLQQAGYDTLQAASGEDALRIAIESEPDLAILDFSMPGMSGIELARRLREERAVPFMFLSAYGDPDVVRQAAEHGAVGYLVKPVDTTHIIPTIEAGLARATEISQLRRSKADLTAAIANGRETNMAIGVLMERYRLNRNKAFDILRDYARSSQRKIKDIAVELLGAEETLNLFRPQPERMPIKLDRPHGVRGIGDSSQPFSGD